MPGRSKFSPDQKAEIVLMGIKNPGKISEICRKYEIAPVTFARWKRNYLIGGLEALQRGKKLDAEELMKENEKLKTTIGKLYIELEYVKKKLGMGR